MSCQACRGTGNHCVWLTYVDVRKPRVAVVPNSSTVFAHPQLLEPRVLAHTELDAFSIEHEVHANGYLNLGELPLAARGVVQQELDGLDPRLERVVTQQYLRLAVPRVDVSYELSGTTGTLSLSGTSLVVASTPEAIRPIRRRLVLWPSIVFGLGLLGAIVAASATGKSAYFESSNQLLLMLWLSSVVLAVPWIGGLLRSWRPVLRIRGFRPIELGFAIAWALSLLAIPIVEALSQPKASAVEGALAAGDVAQARLVLDALVEREGESAANVELSDAVLLAEADALDGDERLAKLETIVAHGGTRAEQAAALAREDRLAAIRSHVSAGAPDEAIAAIDRDFATSWRDDSDIAEERARAEELRAEQCSDDICRFVALRAARDAQTTPERTIAFNQLHAQLLTALSTEGDHDELSPAQRIRHSDKLAKFAEHILAGQLNDEQLTKAANATVEWAADQRAAVPLLGADRDTLQALFPDARDSSANIIAVSLEGAELFFNVDAKGVCKGVYAVGPSGHRQLDAPHWSAKRILAQALGDAMAELPKPDGTKVTSSWKADRTKIVARWSGGVPVELRIGDAAP